MQKRVIVWGLGLLLFFVLLVATVFTTRVLITKMEKTNPAEERVANFDQNQDAFVKQVQESAGEYVENAGAPVFENQIVQAQPPRVESENSSRVLGTETPTTNESEKWIDVNLTEQKLTTWKGTQKLKEYPVSTGISRYPTVKGEFRVITKVLSQAYRGGSKEQGNYYYLPNVPYSLFFYKGYAIHGAYWHNDFGIRPRSHGCVNMRISDAKEVYEWATPIIPAGVRTIKADDTNPGTRIVIHD